MNTTYDHNPNIDSKDRVILIQRWTKRDEIQGPRVGDFVEMPDGTLRRFTYDWGEDIQTTTATFGEGSHYLCDTGGVSYSGALDQAIPKNDLTLIEGEHLGRFWFFHHDVHVGHNGVDVVLPCRLYRYAPSAPPTA